METLSIDLETYSDVDLTQCGVYAYTSSPDFEILLMAYAYDDEPVQVVDLASGEKIPKQVLEALRNDAVTKTAFNAQFERVCLSRVLNTPLCPVSWQCTAVHSARLGLPLSLEGVAQVLGLELKKLKEGKDLIRTFSVPCQGNRADGQIRRNLPGHAPEKWAQFKEYCKRDVEVERSIRKKLENVFYLNEKEERFYRLDQEINDRGILVDQDLVRQAITAERRFKREASAKAQALTGQANPNSVAQLKAWLLQQGISVDNLSKKTVADLAKKAKGDVKELLQLRLQLAKTSVKKYEAIERAVCPDLRVRGLLQFYGANRTGRWAGRLVQVQNLPQNHLEDLSLARELIKEGQFEEVELLFGSIPSVLSELIRTAFIPKPGYHFLVADFSAIEARVIAWLAGEKWRMDVFKTHGLIYEASASQMFRIPIEEITKGSDLRQKGKIAELALGYGGSVGALTAMGALEMGLASEELLPLVTAWRRANPAITRFWWDIDRAALKVIKEKTSQWVGRMKLEASTDFLWITLPSGRRLSYLKPRIERNAFGREGITFEGIGENKRWSRMDSYGPKLVENIVQGTARDVLAEAMLNLDQSGYEICCHVHDEVILEVPNDQDALEEVCALLSRSPQWAEGLPLRAEAYTCEYYRKD
jgi:DNA polymerase bacteriophage-type